MPIKNNYWKTLLGTNAQVLVAKAAAYTTDLTYTLFVANAVEGELGVFLESDKSLVSGLTAADVAAEIFIAVKRDGLIETTVPFVVGSLKKTLTAYAAPQKQSSTTVIGALTLAKGDILEIGILETTQGYQPFPTYNWSIVATAAEAIDDAIARLVTAINDTASKANKDRDLIVTASYVSGTNTLTLAAKDYGVTFRVQLRGVLADGGAGAVDYTTTPCKLGSGFPAQVRLMQDAGDVYKGVTTQYPLQGATAADFGVPTDFVSDAAVYSLFVLGGFASEASRTPHKKQYFSRTIVLAIPEAGGALDEVTAILDL